MKTVFVILLALIGVYVVFRIFQKISVDKNIAEIIRKDVVILDVRTEQEYKEGHIEHSVNIPLGSLEMDSEMLDKEKSYVVCCASGVRSLKAAHLLKSKGFRKVYNGGGWKELKKQL